MSLSQKIKSDDRVLIIKPTSKTAVSSTGLVDPRLFTGENKLHAIRQPNNIWYFKYTSGGLPEPLKQKFNSFEKCLDHARRYYAQRNLEITEVID